jgi:uncharacterized protein
MEFKAIALELKAADDGNTVEGYGSVFGNIDSYGDMIEPGAFRASIANRRPKMLWQHKMDKPIGVWDEVREDDRGLFMRGRIADTEQGREAKALVQMGALDGLSIGFRTMKDEMDGNTRRLKEIDLWEVSFVTIPANAAATITALKGMETERAFETMLREQGFSRWDAKIITAGGWKAWAEQRDAAARDLDADQRDAEAVKSELLKLLQGVSPCRT